MNLIDSNLNQKKLATYNSIKNCKKIYLDTNHWLKLRDRKKDEDSLYIKIFTTLEKLIEDDKCIVPISEFIFWEILKQNDIQTLKESAALIDLLSKGISIVSDEEKRQLEFLTFLQKSSKEPITKVEELIWTKLSINLFNKEIAELPYSNIKFIDFFEKMSFSDILIFIEKKGPLRAFEFKDNVDYLNLQKEKHKDEHKSFKQMFLAELGGYLDFYRSSLTASMEQFYYLKSGRLPSKKEKEEIDETQLSRLLYNMFKLNKVTTEFPSFSIFPELNASIRWNKSRKYVDGNDTIDFLHATSALPYFDFFFTEKELHTIIDQRKLDKSFNCIVESNPKKLLTLLETIE